MSQNSSLHGEGSHCSDGRSGLAGIRCGILVCLFHFLRKQRQHGQSNPAKAGYEGNGCRANESQLPPQDQRKHDSTHNGSEKCQERPPSPGRSALSDHLVPMTRAKSELQSSSAPVERMPRPVGGYGGKFAHAHDG